MLIMMMDMKLVYDLDDTLSLGLATKETTLLNSVVTDQDKDVRIANMFVVKPWRILESGIIPSFQNLYSHRYVSDVIHWPGVFLGFLPSFGRLISHPAATLRVAYESAKMFFHLKGKFCDYTVPVSTWGKQFQRLLVLMFVLV
jgi:hypothetical protein